MTPYSFDSHLLTCQFLLYVFAVVPFIPFSSLFSLRPFLCLLRVSYLSLFLVKIVTCPVLFPLSLFNTCWAVLLLFQAYGLLFVPFFSFSSILHSSFAGSLHRFLPVLRAHCIPRSTSFFFFLPKARTILFYLPSTAFVLFM